MDEPTSRDLISNVQRVAPPPSAQRSLRGWQFNQEKIVFVITIVLFASFCLTLDQFATAGNLISLLQSVAVLGVLGVGSVHAATT